MSDHGNAIFDLSHKVIVVTGGNGGIGLGIAKGLARAGASLSIWARNAEKSADAKSEIESLGADVQTLSCDVSSEEDVVRATAETLERYGRIDVGFANAGFGAGQDPLEMSLADWRHVLATNLDGTFLTFRELGRHMASRDGNGKLIAISSISAQSGTPMQVHYAASKAGVEALVRSLAVRLARYDIQVNAVQPGWIVTDATRPATQIEAFSDVVVKRTPARRWGETEEMAGIALYLASDASSFHTGDTIRVDGGYAVF
ncbi:MAG: SDR family oxidoreductase [Deltaproteobacteria bacterium]|nr:SDR family oxidoreductase [Deltaproteobacteria bacterium]MBW2697956.1 SDR family oxidoreductase [Deltaproteobacteria bacterium]